MSESAPQTKKEAARQEWEAAAERLRAWLPPGSTVYTVLRHVSRSGMSRDIDLYCWVPSDKPEGEPVKMYLSGYVATVLGERRTYQGAIKVGRCGMDMGYHLVNGLSWNLYPNGFACIGAKDGKRCPSNDHRNRYLMEKESAIPLNACRDHVEQSVGACKNMGCEPWWHKSGDYVLRHEWI